MSVVARKGKRHTIYWVATSYRGRVHWVRSGTDKRAAERLNAEREKQKRDGTFAPEHTDGARTTVRGYAIGWLEKRRNRTASDDRQRITDHVLPRAWFADLRIADVEPRHLIRLAQELNATHLSASSVSNTYGALRTMFRDARIERLTTEDPCVLPRGTIKRREKKERGVYSREEVRRLLECEAVPWAHSVLLAILFYTGMREGEACGRRWRDLDMSVSPLACLGVVDQYDGQPLKTDNPRKVPVHPELREILEEWRACGFELLTCRQPRPEDFIVPNVGPRAKAAHHTKSTCYKAFRRACEVSGVPARTLHATRHTFVSWLRRAGADKAQVEKLTHNAAGDIVDQYTHYDWIPLCETVEKLDFGSPQTPRRAGSSTGNPGNGGSGEIPGSARKDPVEPDAPRVRFPASPLQTQHKTSHAVNSCQRQRKERLEQLARLDPEAAAPGLAVCRGLDAAFGVAEGRRNAARDLARALEDGAAALEAAGGGR